MSEDVTANPTNRLPSLESTDGDSAKIQKGLEEIETLRKSLADLLVTTQAEITAKKEVALQTIAEAVSGAKEALSTIQQAQTQTTEIKDSAKATLERSVEEILTNARNGLTKATELVATAQAAATANAESQKLLASSVTDAQAKLTDITSAATQATAAKTQITDEQAVIATKSTHIQGAQEHADKVRGDLDRALTTATQQANEAEGQKTRTQSAADNAATLLVAIQTTKGSSETDAGAIKAARQAAEEATAVTKNLADKSASVEERIAAYEKQIADLGTQYDAQLKAIVGLLPGATTVGLAYAYDDRRKTFLKPLNRWQWTFLGSVVAIIFLTGHGLMHVYASGVTPSYDELLRMWICRLPVAGALVWLAMHASNEVALAKRMEEDYGYKVAVASSFLGFHKQMSEIGGAATTNAPLAKLCSDTLTTLASPPGRIYDKHKLTVSPTNELTETAKAVTEMVKVPKLGA